MKLNTKVWGALALGAMLGLATGPVVQAQDGNQPQQGQGRRGGALRRILTELDLTAEQKPKVEPLVTEAIAAQRAVRENAALSQEEKRTKNREIVDGLKVKLKPILTEAQYTKLEEITKPRQRRQQN